MIQTQYLSLTVSFVVQNEGPTDSNDPKGPKDSEIPYYYLLQHAFGIAKPLYLSDPAFWALVGKTLSDEFGARALKRCTRCAPTRRECRIYRSDLAERPDERCDYCIRHKKSCSLAATKSNARSKPQRRTNPSHKPARETPNARRKRLTSRPRTPRPRKSAVSIFPTPDAPLDVCTPSPTRNRRAQQQHTAVSSSGARYLNLSRSRQHDENNKVRGKVRVTFNSVSEQSQQ